MRPDTRETPFEDALLRLAFRLGWRAHAERPARSADGDRVFTAIKGHQGWPDIVVAHPTKGIVVAELKSARGTLGPGQREWVDVFAVYDQPGSPILVEIWKPADWAAIEVCLNEGVHVYRARFRVTPAGTTG